MPDDVEDRLRADLSTALGTIAAMRRALELSRVWWDDADPYHAPWSHKYPCDVRPCAACTARDAIRAILEAK